VSQLARLFEHNAWADDRAIAAMRRAAAEGRPAARTLEILAHVLGAEEVWASRIEGRPSTTAVWPVLDVDQCAELAASVHAALRRAAVSPAAALDAPVHYTNSAGAEFDSRLEDILLHVALHGAYHRGQIAMLLRDAGAEPAPTDYIAFVRGAPAAVRKGEEATRPQSAHR
jgi:uncharacterized damage-inducible protein DinB